ncbi:MAG TPA: transglutaminase domain-containing protein, partial [Spirochaetota bacterium]|nr:transglutaminase domain-containing protein [Spirochaetota bacterium]
MKTNTLAKISIFLNLILIVFLLYNSGLFDFSREKKIEHVSFTENSEARASSRSADGDYKTTLLEQEAVAFSSKGKQHSPAPAVHEDIKSRLSRDIYLQLQKLPSPRFDNSRLKQHLRQVPGMKVYILACFRETLNYKIMHKIKAMGFVTVGKKSVNEYFENDIGIFYGKYHSLQMIKKLRALKELYLLTKYTAKGYYQLDIRTMQDQEDFVLKIFLPFENAGRKLLLSRPSFNGLGVINFKKKFSNYIKVGMDIEKQRRYTFFCNLRYVVDLPAILSHHIRINGDMTLADYRSRTGSIPQYQLYTGYAGKIMPSGYVSNIAAGLNMSSNTLKNIWDTIYKRLNEDITYNYRKRYLFFQGKLAYSNIEDMYMTVPELSSSKKGACPERSSLEVAILRDLGIAARTVTRL